MKKPTESRGGPLGTVKAFLKCDDEMAATVVKNLGGVLSHEPTRAFLSIAWHLGNTTMPVNGKTNDVLINEGKRMAGLFLVQCAKAGLDLSVYNGEER